MRSKRILATLMALVMCLSLLPGVALAMPEYAPKNVKVKISMPTGNGTGFGKAKVTFTGDKDHKDYSIEVKVRKKGSRSFSIPLIESGSITTGDSSAPQYATYQKNEDGTNTYTYQFPYLSDEFTGAALTDLQTALDKQKTALEKKAAFEQADSDHSLKQSEAQQAAANLTTAQESGDAAKIAEAQAAKEAAEAAEAEALQKRTDAESVKNEAVADALAAKQAVADNVETQLSYTDMTLGSEKSDVEQSVDTALKNAESNNGELRAEDKQSLVDAIASNVGAKGEYGGKEYNNGEAWTGIGAVMEGDALQTVVFVYDGNDEIPAEYPVAVEITKSNSGKTFDHTGEVKEGSGGGGGSGQQDVDYSATVICKTSDGGALPDGVNDSTTVTWKKSTGETYPYTPTSISGWTVSPASAALSNGGTTTFTYTRSSSEVVVEAYSATVTFTSANNAAGTPPTGVEPSETVTWQSSEGATKTYTPAAVPGYGVSPASATLENGKTYAFTYSKKDLVVANGGYTLTVNYLIPVGPKYGNLKVASKTEYHPAGETYSVPSPNYMDLTPGVNPVTGTMPSSNLTVDVVYSPLYSATVTYKLAPGASEPQGVVFHSIARQEGLVDGAAYHFDVPSYDGLVADRKQVDGNITGANADETVTYKKDDFTVIVKYQSGGNVSSDNLVSFMEQAGGYAKSGYHDGEFYSVPSPSYYGVRPLQDKVEGYIEWADVEKVVYYTDACTNPGGHNWVVTHDGNTHKEKCSYCEIEKAPIETEVTYESLGEGSNMHAVQCGVCGKELRQESCSASAENSAVGNTACSGSCKNCGGTFEYGDNHDYTGQKWTASAGGSTHEKVCNRCGHVEKETCNATGWVHQGSGAGAQHATACSICGGNVGAWQNCSYNATKISGGRHTFQCVCGRTNGTANCHFELVGSTASTHTYQCQECNATISGNHNRCSRKEDERPATKYSYAGYTRVYYCGRCGYEISRSSVGGGAKQLPVSRLRSEKVKTHFIFGGGGRARSGGGSVTQSTSLIAPQIATVISEGIDDYLLDNYDTLLLVAEDALDAYYDEHPDNRGEGWSIDLEPVVTLNMTSYDEQTHTLTVDISATYNVRLSNDAGGVDVLIGQNYPLTVDFPVDLEFDVPAGMAANGATLYVRHNHNGTYYYYTATLTAAEDGAMPTASFTAEHGFSTFEISLTSFQGGGDSGGGSSGGGGGSSGGGSSGGSSGGGAASSGSSGSDTTTRTDASGNKVESKSDTKTKTNADGSVEVTTSTTDTITGKNGDKTEKTGTASVTTKNNGDGSVTETTKASETTVTTAQNGGKTTVEKTTEAESTTKATADGGTTVTEKATEVAVATTADGVKTTTETKTESTEKLDKSGNGTIVATKTETVKDASGKVTETIVTESKGDVKTAENGTKTTVLTNTAVKTDADGKQTVTVTTEQKSETPTGTIAAVVQDESGAVLSAGVNVSEADVEKARTEGGAIPVLVTMPAVSEADAAGTTPMQIEMPASVSSTGEDTNGAVQTASGRTYIEVGVEQSGPGVIAEEKDPQTGELKKVTACFEGSVILPVYGSCEIVIVDNTRSFDDVAADSWYHDSVTFVAAREIFNGTSATLFAPDASMTRGMLAQALYNFDRSASPKTSSFADTAGKWYEKAAGWASYEGVITGTDKGFEGEANVTREQVATMLYRYAKLLGADVSASADLSGYADADSVSVWALDAMRWAVGTGLVNGVNGRLDPQGNATRAQLAAIMQRFCEKALTK